MYLFLYKSAKFSHTFERQCTSTAIVRHQETTISLSIEFCVAASLRNLNGLPRFRSRSSIPEEERFFYSRNNLKKHRLVRCLSSVIVGATCFPWETFHFAFIASLARFSRRDKEEKRRMRKGSKQDEILLAWPLYDEIAPLDARRRGSVIKVSVHKHMNVTNRGKKNRENGEMKCRVVAADTNRGGQS